MVTLHRAIKSEWSKLSAEPWNTPPHLASQATAARQLDDRLRRELQPFIDMQQAGLISSTEFVDAVNQAANLETP